jgi:hypothetical protein
MDSAKGTSASGLQTVFDVILAPSTAFERLRTSPTWGWALALVIVVYSLAQVAITPAIIHGFQAQWPSMMAQNPRMAQLTPEQAQQGLAIAVTVMHFAWIWTIVMVPIVLLAIAAVMYLFSALGRGSATFLSMWAAAVNIAVVPMVVGGIVLAAIVMLRGANSFSSISSVTAASPSLAWLLPSANVKVTMFFASLNIFAIWAAVLTFIAMRVTARASTISAVLVAVLLPVTLALLAAAGAR